MKPKFFPFQLQLSLLARGSVWGGKYVQIVSEHGRKR